LSEPVAEGRPARDANRLGALALRLSDRIEAAVAVEGVRSPSAASALSSIERFFVDPPTIDELRRVLGLTSSGTVRLVDALEHDGLVARGRGRDGRTSTVTLTSRGRAVSEQVVAARAVVLTEALGVLSAQERHRLAPLLDKLLTGLVEPRPSGPAMCRLCATEACGADRGDPCPVVLIALGAASREPGTVDPPG
jgi:DNA-binding MarR family transcriptional regulator